MTIAYTEKLHCSRSLIEYQSTGIYCIVVTNHTDISIVNRCMCNLCMYKSQWCLISWKRLQTKYFDPAFSVCFPSEIRVCITRGMQFYEYRFFNNKEKNRIETHQTSKNSSSSDVCGRNSSVFLFCGKDCDPPLLSLQKYRLREMFHKRGHWVSQIGRASVIEINSFFFSQISTSA